MDTINAGLKRYALEVEAKLRELKIDFDFTNVVYVGGGSGVMRRFGSCTGENVRYVTDVRANALGCVPYGNGNKTSTCFWKDSIRLPEYHNGTYEYLKSLGIEEI